MKAKPVNYKYACFSCRKCFAREANWFQGTTTYTSAKGKRTEYRTSFPQLTATCPHCGGVMYFMGKKFKPPRRQDVKAWRKWETAGRRWYTWWLTRARTSPEQLDPYFSDLYRE
jgi:tRNA G26 N,N-dimethylase Trm1